VGNAMAVVDAAALEVEVFDWTDDELSGVELGRAVVDVVFVEVGSGVGVGFSFVVVGCGVGEGVGSPAPKVQVPQR